MWIKIRNQRLLKRNFYHCRIRRVIEFWRDWLPWRRLTVTEYFLSIIRCPVESDMCEYSDRKSSSKSAEAFYYGRQRKTINAERYGRHSLRTSRSTPSRPITRQAILLRSIVDGAGARRSGGSGRREADYEKSKPGWSPVLPVDDNEGN